MLSSVRQAPLQQLAGTALRCLSTSASTLQQAAPQSDTIEVFVNDEAVNIPKGSTVLQACDAAGIDIPRSDTAAGVISMQNGMRGLQDSWLSHPALHMQVLLPPQAVNRRQLPHVPS